MKTKLIPINSCGIILSYKCQSACKHCLYSCGPNWEGWINKEKLEKLLTDIKYIWSHYTINRSRNILFQGVHLAGGEPFLNFPLLLDAVKTVINTEVELGYVETNAGWCRDREDVYEKFKALFVAGLRRIFISCSPFHAEKIPLKNTLLAIEIAQEVFSPQGVIIYLPHCLDQIAQFGLDKPVGIEKYIEKFGKERTGEILWEGYGLIPGGRSGYHLGHLCKKYPPIFFEDQNCTFEILYSQHAHFDLYGNYIPYFCGGFSIGNTENLQSFYENFDLEKLPLCKILVESGPYGLMKFAKEKFNYQEAPEGYVGKCHLCVDVRRYLNSKTDEFCELRPKQFYQFL